MKKQPRFNSDDFKHMAKALSLASAVKGATFPNPAVGAVVVRGGKIVGSGATAPAGGPHAEVTALRKAGRASRGSTLYVSLEPCCHFGRTPPCTAAIVAAGVDRVIIPCRDPNPVVSGKGVAVLRKNGIKVEPGLMAEEAGLLNEDFFWSIRAKSAWITLKLAMTLDGRIADFKGTSKWITCPGARTFVHRLRSFHAGIAVGRKTLEKDNPELTVRHVKGPSPVRFVFASHTGADKKCIFRSGDGVRSVIVCPGKKEGDKSVTAAGIEIWRTGYLKTPENLELFARMAFEDGLTSILVEGGSGLASSFMEAGLVNRLYLFYGNRILGGGLSGFCFGPLELARAFRLENPGIFCFDDSFAVTGLPVKEE